MSKATERGVGVGEPLLDRRLVGEIDGLGRDHLPAGGAHQFHRLLAFRDLHVAADDPGTLGRELQRRLSPLATRGAADDGDLAGQSSLHLSPGIWGCIKCLIKESATYTI